MRTAWVMAALAAVAVAGCVDQSGTDSAAGESNEPPEGHVWAQPLDIDGNVIPEEERNRTISVPAKLDDLLECNWEYPGGQPAPCNDDNVPRADFQPDPAALGGWICVPSSDRSENCFRAAPSPGAQGIRYDYSDVWASNVHGVYLIEQDGQYATGLAVWDGPTPVGVAERPCAPGAERGSFRLYHVAVETTGERLQGATVDLVWSLWNGTNHPGLVLRTTSEAFFVPITVAGVATITFGGATFEFGHAYIPDVLVEGDDYSIKTTSRWNGSEGLSGSGCPPILGVAHSGAAGLEVGAHFVAEHAVAV